MGSVGSRGSGGWSGVADLRLDVRFALRALAKSPGFTASVMATLALGIGAATAMFSVLGAALGRDLPFPEPERLVLGRATFNGNVNPWASFPDYVDYRDQVGALESLAVIGGGAMPVTVTGGDEPMQARSTSVSANLFETLGVRPQLGTSFSVEEAPAGGGGEIIISDGLWRRWFGGVRDVVGRSLLVDAQAFTVVGVMPPGFRFLYDADLWVPPWHGNSDPSTRQFHNWLMVGRLRPGATLDVARTEADVVSARLREAYPESNRTKALQLDGLHGALAEGYRRNLFLLTGAIVLVLLIACGNVASLLMARGSARSAELSVRAALGAGRSRLARQLLVECGVLATASGAAGVAVAVLLERLILRFVSMDLLGVTRGGLSWTMLAIALGLSCTTTVLFGVYPSVSAARTDLAGSLREAGRRAGSRHGLRFRSGLVVLQMAVSTILLVGAGLLIQSLDRLRSVDLGFRTEGLLTATFVLPPQRYAEAGSQVRFVRELREAVAALPGVTSVAFVSRLPLADRGGNYHVWNPEAPPDPGTRVPWADRRSVLPGYFKAMDVPLVAGRDLSEGDVEGAPAVAVLSKSSAEELFPGQDPLGRRVAMSLGGSDPLLVEIVGVVADHRTYSLDSAARPTIFLPYAQLPERRMSLTVAAADPLALARPIQARIREMDRDILLSDVRTMDDVVVASISDARSMTTMLGLFALAALALAALGLYGVLAFFVARRTHEIGIRVALGATAGQVLRLVVARGLALAAGGAALGAVGSIWAVRAVRAMLFETSTADPTAVAGVTGFFLLVSLAACALPAWKALRVDPAEAFRAE